MRTLDYIADDYDDGCEIKTFLRRKGISHSLLTLLKKENGIIVGGVPARAVDKLTRGDKVTIIINDSSDIAPNSSLSSEIVYDDEDLVVFDKPAGMPVHRSFGHDDDTLENLFAALYPELSFRAVSRLDKNTSGLVIVAKNKLAAARLMSDSRFRPEKKYYAVAQGELCVKFGSEGEIIAPIARESESIIKRVVRDDGVFAHTKFRVISSNEDLTFAEITLMTGRTHQIRVHFSYAGYPLAGDDLYGGNTEIISRQALHCGNISFIHPVTEKRIILTTELPDDMKKILNSEY